jgi:poly-gamma-glutamate synthesis protein (capsule biosynthesis protein)
MCRFLEKRGVDFMLKKLIATFVFLLVAAEAFAQVGDFRLILAGDTNLHQRLSIYDDPAFLAFFKRIQTADAAFLNIESHIQPDRFPGSPGYKLRRGGIYLASPEFILDEFKWAGFNLFSVANNHAFDYGEDGLRTSVRTIHDKGLVYAGAGENSALARAPGYLDTNHGRVALIALSSTLLTGSWAGPQREDLPGRFGVNPLRYVTTYTVQPEALRALREVAALRGPWAVNDNGPTLSFEGALFQDGGEVTVHTKADKRDLEGLLASIRDARQQADFVIVTIHAHESSPATPSKVADFVVEAAHAAIDAGADVFANHGPMDAHGIEIYKGKPIFYGLGNFAFDGHVQPLQPAKLYELHGLPQTSTNSDLWITHEPDGVDNPIYRPWRQETRESATYELIFGPDGKLKQIAIDPISLLWAKGPNAEKDPETRAFHTRAGVPGPASPEVAARVFERIVKQSEALGTKVSVSGGRAYVRIP